MAIEGGERGPNGSPNIFLAIKHDAVTTRNRSRRGGGSELATWLATRSALYVTAIDTPVDAYRGGRLRQRRRRAEPVAGEHRELVRERHRGRHGDVRRTQSRSRRAKKYGRAPAGAAYRDVNT